MLTAACALASLAILAASMLFAYVLGRLKKIRGTEGYKSGFAAGERHGEYKRNGLLERIADLHDERDQLAEQLAEVTTDRNDWERAAHEALSEVNALLVQSVDAAYEDAREVNR